MAAIAVGLGAFGAHGLGDRFGPEALGWWQTGVQYQMWHALALLAIGLGSGERATGPAAWLGAGALLFASTLYALALGAPRWLGAVTPVGGAMMIGGWLWLAVRLAARRRGKSDSKLS
jgi:uncharacterized membrane protein YgdD (TMEM256/DUF423 family)